MLKQIKTFYFVSMFLTCFSLAGQRSIATDSALQRFHELDSISKVYQQENRIKDYINIYFKMWDLLPTVNEHPEVALVFHKSRGEFFLGRKLLNEALKNNKLAIGYVQELDSLSLTDHFETSAKLMGQNASNYIELGQLDSAYLQLRAAISYVKTEQRYWPIAYPSAINNMGHCFQHQLHIPDSALHYYFKADSIIRVDFGEKEHLIGSVRDNIATVYVSQKKFKTARDLFKINFDLYDGKYFVGGGPDYKRWTRAGAQYAAMEIKLGRLSSANTILDSVQNILRSYPKEYNRNDWNWYWKTKEKYYLKIEDYKQAYKARDRALEATNTELIQKIDIEKEWEQKLNHIIFDRSQRNYLNNRKRVDEKRRKELIQLWSLVSLLCLAILGVFIFYRQNLKDVKQKKLISDQDLRLKKLENEILHQNIELNKRDLSDFALNYVQDMEWAHVLSEKLTHFKKSRGNNRSMALKDFEKEIENKIKLKENNPELYEKVDLLSHEFYQKLSLECPNLTKSEIRLCSLIRLKLDSSHISQLLNISQSSLHQARYRLRKKLGLTAQESLDDYCCNL